MATPAEHRYESRAKRVVEGKRGDRRGVLKITGCKFAIHRGMGGGVQEVLDESESDEAQVLRQ